MWDLIRMFFWLPPAKPKKKGFWDDAMDLAPGHVTVVTDGRTGNQYALMPLDDFDHVAALAKLERRNLVLPQPCKSGD